MKFDQKVQLIIVGESCVGKTSILYKYTKDFFTNQHLATIGLEYFTTEEKINDKVIRVKIWDTAGQEQYKSLTKNFYKNSNGVFIVYDVTNKSSFEKVQEWIQSVIDNGDENIKMVLIGNKIDLNREVKTEEGQAIANKYKMPFFETSAKENINIRDSVMKLVNMVIETQKPREEGLKLEDRNNPNNNSEGGSGCKC